MGRFAVAALVAGALLSSTAAHAQSRALVLKEQDPWGYTSTTDELDARGIPYDVVDSTQFATSNLFGYSMVLVSSCQPDAVYSAWNARIVDLEQFVNVGGFIGIHNHLYFCGASTGSVIPQPPGGNISVAINVVSDGSVLAPADPMMLGVPAAATASALFSTTGMSGLQGSDQPLLSVGSFTGVFRRQVGVGTVIVSSIALEEGYALSEDAGVVLINEIGEGFALGSICTTPDTDNDTICDPADVCPGFDDLSDADGDSVPDGCDICPLSSTDDSDNDGVCDNLDLCLGFDDSIDADGDNFPDPCDNCLGLANPFQQDADNDGAGDECDVCPRDEFDDADNDGVCGDVDLCDGFDDSIDADADLIPDGCDNCENDSNYDQVDSDFDGIGDACDDCFDIGAPVDGDGDGRPNSCDVCPYLYNPYQEDADGDMVGDICDICPYDYDPDQFDWDDDGLGDACDLCAFGPNELDRDSDGTPDDCDPCPDDPLDDSDGDGVCDGVDKCEGVDDALDSDADGVPDACDNCPEDFNRPQNDRDGDGFGSACDCDDRNPEALPGGIEICDGADNDCNGATDDVDGEVNLFFPDFDGDGSGDPTGLPVQACEQPSGYSADFGDCDDKNPERSPDAIEWCDDIDNDCDGIVDGPRCTPLSAANCGCAATTDGPLASWMTVGLLLAAMRRRRS